MKFFATTVLILFGVLVFATESPSEGPKDKPRPGDDGISYDYITIPGSLVTIRTCTATINCPGNLILSCDDSHKCEQGASYVQCGSSIFYCP